MPKLTDQNKAKIYRLYCEAGLSYDRIGEETGFPRWAVRNAIDQAIARLTIEEEKAVRAEHNRRVGKRKSRESKARAKKAGPQAVALYHCLGCDHEVTLSPCVICAAREALEAGEIRRNSVRIEEGDLEPQLDDEAEKQRQIFYAKGRERGNADH